MFECHRPSVGFEILLKPFIKVGWIGEEVEKQKGNLRWTKTLCMELTAGAGMGTESMAMATLWKSLILMITMNDLCSSNMSNV